MFDFFENKVRSTHPNDSAQYIRQWQSKMLKFLTETEADTVATVSHSHGWNTNDVYTLKSAAKDELVSLKYMMILIRLADLLDLANDRIDYYLLRENRSQMARSPLIDRTIFFQKFAGFHRYFMSTMTFYFQTDYS